MTEEGKVFRDHKISLTKKETISLIKESKRILKFVRKKIIQNQL